MFISLMTRFITSIGHGAPAMMPVRSEVRSKRAEFGMIEFGDEHGRHAVERRASLLLDGLQRRQRIKAFAGIDHRRAVRHRGEIAHHHAEAMIERHRDADAVVLGQPHGAADEIAVVEDVVVGQRHALRRARGAAGELDVDRIVELQRFGQFRQPFRGAARCPSASRHRTRSCRALGGPPIWITARSLAVAPPAIRRACDWQARAAACSSSPCSSRS